MPTGERILPHQHINRRHDAMYNFLVFMGRRLEGIKGDETRRLPSCNFISLLISVLLPSFSHSFQTLVPATWKGHHIRQVYSRFWAWGDGNGRTPIETLHKTASGIESWRLCIERLPSQRDEFLLLYNGATGGGMKTSV